jgi:muramoyltetrapeptide carboxypeptidase LdcA involved in peptidoglycan recycling
MLLSYIFVAPSSGIDRPDVLKKVIKEAKVIGEVTPVQRPAMDRFKILKKAFEENPNYIWSIRGGFGMTEVLYLLEKNHIKPPRDSIYVGYSDVTILHLWLRRQQKISVHGMMPYFCKQASEIHHKSANEKSDFSFDPFSQPKLSFEVLYNPKNLKEEKSSFIGGNLSCLHSQLGTATTLQGHNQIIFIEEIEEPLPHQIRLLTAMIKARTFEGSRGILLGNTGYTKEIAAFLHEQLPDLWIIHSERFGHADYNDFLPFGYEATIDFKKSELTFNFAKKCLYKPRNFRRVEKVLTGDIDIIDLLSLNGQNYIIVKGILTLPYTEIGPRFMRHIVNAIRAGNFPTNTIKIRRHVLSHEDKIWCERELWNIARMKIQWV